VDDPLALSLLRVMGCDLVQGYLISPPVALEELELFLRTFDGSEHLSSPLFTTPNAGAV
jgi:EAL domain-containing protein (putative c-di-GMP-specific phosphodiesterase class I)